MQGKILTSLLLNIMMIPVVSRAQVPDWTRTARIVGICPEDSSEVQPWVDWAANSGATVIDVDVDINNTYPHFIRPDTSIGLLAYTTEYAHSRGLKVFAYLTGFEILTDDCLDTDGNYLPGVHTIYLDHPEWLQRDINDTPAVFLGEWAHWMSPFDESAWLTPYNPDFRSRYLQSIGRVARETDVEAIYIDVSTFMTGFEGWEDRWPSFDPWMKAAFQAEGGTLPVDIENFDDANFRHWIRFRHETINRFLAEVRDTLNANNPNILLINENYPGGMPDAVTQAGCPYYLISDCDLITHEWEPMGLDAMQRNEYEWLLFFAGLILFKAIDNGAPVWMLAYTDMEHEADSLGDNTRDAALANLANAVIFGGCNFWEAGGLDMCNTSTNLGYREGLFSWLDFNEETFYTPRQPYKAVGIYFSPWTRDYADWAGWEIHQSAFFGTLMALMEENIEVAVITPRTISEADPSTIPLIILPNTQCVSDGEINSFESYLFRGGKIINYGDMSGWSDSTGADRAFNAFDDFASQYPYRYFDRTSVSYGQDYFNATIYDTADNPVNATYPEPAAETAKSSILNDVNTTNFSPGLDISAPGPVIVQPAVVDSFLWFFVVNFDNVHGNTNPQTSSDVIIRYPSSEGAFLEVISFYDETPEVSHLYDSTNSQGIVQISHVGSWRGVVIKLSALTGVRGDVNGDGIINILDVVRAINIILEIEPPPTEDELWAADCNGDENVNVLDVVGIVNVVLGAGTCVL